MEDLRTKAQKVMDVLEKPEVIAALRQDKAQNLQYLKENYKVSDEPACFIFIYFTNKVNLVY
jgi:translation initiation factor 3 subunit E